MKNGNVANGNGDIKKEEKESYRTIYQRIIFKHKILILVTILVILISIVAITLWIVLNKKSDESETAVSDKLQQLDFRLPSTVSPRRYQLEFKTYLIPNNFMFEGKENVSFECIERTNEIIFHALNLTIDEASIKLRTEDDNELEISQVRYYSKFHLVIIELNQYLNVSSSYWLTIHFSGTMLKDGKGIFYSKYEDNQRNVNYLASTQFEPIYARKAFPCFDEPAMKAQFDIRLVRWKNMTSLSNMPKLNTISLNNDWEVDIYETSLKMSTYLLAFVVGNFTGETREKISIWGHPESIASANFSLNFAPKALKFFEDLLGLPYELSKLDMVAVRSDKVIAMENWGVVIAPEHHLLYDEESKSQRKQETIVGIINHEIAHQWFGDLVTPKWWSDIWLNEGLSTYMEHVVSTSFFPEWNKIDKTLYKVSEKLFENQCGDFSKFGGRVSLNLEKFEDVDTRRYFFESDIYNKGAMIIHMVHRILGNETFWKGINIYLKENAYGNVVEKTLWDSLSMAQPSWKKPKVDLIDKMKPWSQLLGVPIVSVERHYENQTASLSQVSCLAKHNKKHKNDLWPIPISYVTQDHWDWNPRINEWLKTEKMTMKNMPLKNEWLLVNGHGIGLYIVNYDKTNWKLLGKQLKSNHQVFSPSSRFKLLNDAVVLYKLNYIDFTTLLDLYAYIGSETEFSVLKVENIRPLLEFTRIMEDMDEEKKWRDFLNYIFEPIYDKLGWTVDTESEKYNIMPLRKTIFDYLCENDHKDCENKTRDLFTRWKTNSSLVEYTELELLNLCSIVKYGTREDWNYVHDLYLVVRNPIFLTPLFCTKNQKLFTRLFGVFLNQEKLQYAEKIFKNIFENKNFWIEFLNFFDNQFERITEFHKIEDLMVNMKEFLENELIFNQFESICRKHFSNMPETKIKVIKDMLTKCKRKVLKRNREVTAVNKWLKKESWLRKES